MILWSFYLGFEDPLGHCQEKIPNVEFPANWAQNLHIYSSGRDALRPRHLPCCLKNTQSLQDMLTWHSFHILGVLNLANIQLLEGYFVPNRQQLSPKSYNAGVFLSHLVK